MCATCILGTEKVVISPAKYNLITRWTLYLQSTAKIERNFYEKRSYTYSLRVIIFNRTRAKDKVPSCRAIRNTKSRDRRSASPSLGDAFSPSASLIPAIRRLLVCACSGTKWKAHSRCSDRVASLLLSSDPPTCTERKRRNLEVAFACSAGVTRPFNRSRLRSVALKGRICSPYSCARCQRCNTARTKRERERERRRMALSFEFFARTLLTVYRRDGHGERSNCVEVRGRRKGNMSEKNNKV